MALAPEPTLLEARPTRKEAILTVNWETLYTSTHAPEPSHIVPPSSTTGPRGSDPPRVAGRWRKTSWRSTTTGPSTLLVAWTSSTPISPSSLWGEAAPAATHLLPATHWSFCLIGTKQSPTRRDTAAIPVETIRSPRATICPCPRFRTTGNRCPGHRSPEVRQHPHRWMLRFLIRKGRNLCILPGITSAWILRQCTRHSAASWKPRLGRLSAASGPGVRAHCPPRRPLWRPQMPRSLLVR